MEQYETHEEFIYALIIEDLDGSISVADQALLKQWRDAAPENEKTYQDFLNIQLGLDKLYHQPIGDAEASWSALDAKLTEPQQAPIHTVRRMPLWYAASAAVLVLMAAGYYFFSVDKYTRFSTAKDAALTQLVLPDGTELQLNAGTSVKYRKSGFNEDRKLELLNGEVFINVNNHSQAHPFRVVVGAVEAQDIGTSFNVAKNDTSVAVIVEEGKVSLKHPESGKEVMLTAGKMGWYQVANQELNTAENKDPNYKAWIDRRFVFSEMPLKEVLDQFQRVYQSPIRIQDDVLKDRKLTARLHYQTLDSALAVISASLQCKITREKGAYVLSEK